MLDMNEKIRVKNLCNWSVSFKRINSNGDVFIAPNTAVSLSRDEVYSQIQSGNTMFAGTDGLGSHARIYIMDKDTRVDLDFEDADGKKTQNIVDDNKLKEIFAIKTKAAFEKAVKEFIVTNAEKHKLVEGVHKFKLNEFDKIRFIEDYTGIKIN